MLLVIVEEECDEVEIKGEYCILLKHNLRENRFSNFNRAHCTGTITHPIMFWILFHPEKHINILYI